MPNSSRRGSRLFLPLLATVALASAAIAGARTVPPELRRDGSVYALRGGTDEYAFDAAWRTESLWRRGGDGTWQREASPDTARLEGMRRLFLLRLGCSKLGDIPVEGQAEMGALKSLGYL